MTGPEMEKALEGIPKVLWVNSRMLLMHGPRIRQEPHVIHDAMPDGFHYEPTPEVVTSLINHIKHDAIVLYYGRTKAGEDIEHVDRR